MKNWIISTVPEVYPDAKVLCPLFGITPTDKHLPPKRDNVIFETSFVELRDMMTAPS